MKLIYTLALLFVLTVGHLHAQYDSRYDQSSVEQEQESSAIYLDLSTGIDNHTGVLGIGATIPFAKRFAFRGGVGIGVWGTKASIGVKRQDLFQSGWGFGLGYSFCSGIDDIDITFTDTSGASRVVNMTLKNAGSLNLTINHSWTIWNKGLIFLESGYAVPTGPDTPYEVNSGGPLTADEELIMQILRPGGIILAIGIQIGL